MDLQLLSIIRSLNSFLFSAGNATETRVVIDVGCGQQPFRELFRTEKVIYGGLEIPIASDSFGMRLVSTDLVIYDGARLPIKDCRADIVLLIEVLEHVSDRDTLLGEIYRVLRPGGSVFATLPWSARVHFEPHDPIRWTPFGIEQAFKEKDFCLIEVKARGSTSAVLANKMLIGLVDSVSSKRPAALLYLGLFPIMILLHVIGLVSIVVGISNRLGPLGYTVTAKKSNESMIPNMR